MSFDTSIPWVLLRVREQLFGVPAGNVREMTELPAVTPVPNTPDYVLGLITLRGRVTPTLDLRRRMDVITAEDEAAAIIQRLERAASAFRAWFLGIEQEIGSTGAFRFEMPEEVAGFCSWIGSFHSGNVAVQTQIRKFEEPCRELLGILKSSAGGKGTALGVKQLQSRHFAGFVTALSAACEPIRESYRQVAVVLIHDDREVGITVDEVASIEKLKEGSLEDLPDQLRGLSTSLTGRVARRTRDDAIVLILDIAELLDGTKSIDVGLVCTESEGEEVGQVA